MDNVSVNFDLSLVAQGDDSDIATADLGGAVDKVSVSRGVRYTDGVLTGECDVIYHDILPVTTLDTVDLNGVVIKDAFGVGIAIVKLKALYIKNLTGGELEISNNAAEIFPIFNAATDVLKLPDDGELFMTFPGTGLAIGAATGSLEFVHAEGGAQDVEIIAVGTRS